MGMVFLLWQVGLIAKVKLHVCPFSLCKEGGELNSSLWKVMCKI